MIFLFLFIKKMIYFIENQYFKIKKAREKSQAFGYGEMWCYF